MLYQVYRNNNSKKKAAYLNKANKGDPLLTHFKSNSKRFHNTDTANFNQHLLSSSVSEDKSVFLCPTTDSFFPRDKYQDKYIPTRPLHQKKKRGKKPNTIYTSDK